MAPGRSGRAEHAAKFAELLGDVVTDSTKKNLEMRVDARTALPPASSSWLSWPSSTTWTPSTTPCMRWLATRPVTGKAFEGLLKRYFG